MVATAYPTKSKKAEYRDRIQTMHKTLVKELGEHPDETEQRFGRIILAAIKREPAPTYNV
jgi:hypothetical protein